ncbi:MAG: F0F1 ATP synthase subunit epsilon [Actinomycetota bacterium]
MALLNVQVVSPEEALFTGEAEFILARTVEGEIGILPGHSPVLAQLTASKVKVRPVGGADQIFDIAGGFMTVKDNQVIILTDQIQEVEQ